MKSKLLSQFVNIRKDNSDIITKVVKCRERDRKNVNTENTNAVENVQI